MDTETLTIRALAVEAGAWFESRKRDDDTSYDTLKDGRPDWLHDLVRDAHAGMLPDDWRYAAIRAAIDHLAELDDDDDPDDSRSDYADAQVDTYNRDLTAWLSSHSDRVGYVDQARDEFGAADDAGIMAAIMRGQYVEADEIYGLVLDALRSELDDRNA